jgi:polyisoprenoid-binding protein YceI
MHSMGFRSLPYMAALALALVSVPGLATLHETGTPSVVVHATATAGVVKITMQSNDLSVDEKDGKVTFTSRLDKLTDKDSDLRAKHMREDFQADQFPTVTLVVNRADLHPPAASQPAKAEAGGLLTLHGVTKPVRFTYATSPSENGAFQVSGSTSFDYTQFLGRRITRFGVTVEPPVTVETVFKLNDS